MAGAQARKNTMRAKHVFMQVSVRAWCVVSVQCANGATWRVRSAAQRAAAAYAYL